ncbi:hypothetical protein BDR22DRAFT_888736 [Usnea florida]
MNSTTYAARKAAIVDRNNVEANDDVEMMIPFGGPTTDLIQDTMLITLDSVFKTPPPDANATVTEEVVPGEPSLRLGSGWRTHPYEIMILGKANESSLQATDRQPNLTRRKVNGSMALEFPGGDELDCIFSYQSHSFAKKYITR